MLQNGQEVALPAFIRFDTSTGLITIDQTTDQEVGQYEIALLAYLQDEDETTTQRSFIVTVISQETELTNQCREDQILTDFTVEPIDYKIGVTGVINIEPEWQPNSIQDCPSEFMLLILGDDG